MTVASPRSMRITIRKTSAAAMETILPSLTQLLREVVSTGTPMGFLPPLSEQAAEDYWRSIKLELEAGSRILLTAHTEEGLVGTGQLALCQRQNAPHRAEVEKLFVTAAARGRGVGTLLMQGLHCQARANGRTLLVLNTRVGLPAVEFYKALGYKEAGVIPGWSIGVAGERYGDVIMYGEF
jgi:acetyltransferase